MTENEYVQGPGPDYSPPPIDDLRDDEYRTRTHRRGRDLVLQVLADIGIRKANGRWMRDGESPTSRTIA